MSATALQLVNRVRNRHRFGETASIASDDLGPPILEALNEAKDEILEGYEWDFNVRHDGVLQTVAKISFDGVGSVTNGSDGVTATGSAETFSDGLSVARLIVTSDGDYGETAFRALTQQDFGGLAVFVLEQDFPGTTDATASIDVLSYEFRLPDTVIDVLSVRHQERDLGLEFVPRNKSWDGVFTRPTESLSDSPDIAYIGSTVNPTYGAGGSTANPGLGIAIYPVPESSYRLDYSYVYSHPELVADTDTIDNVPRKVIDRIVNVAVAKLYLSHVSNDPKLGEAIYDRESTNIARINSRNKPDRARRKRVRSNFGGGSRSLSAGPKNRHVFYEP